MARYAIDAVTVLHLLDDALTPNASHQLVGPGSIRSDVLQLLLQDVKAARRTERDALTAHERLTEFKLRLLGDRVSRRTAWDIARQSDGDSIRLAEPIAIAQLQADALVTIDSDMAARAQGIVPVVSIDALFTD